MRQRLNRLLPRRLREALRPLYLYVMFLSERGRRRSRHASPLLAARHGYALSTPTYLQKTKRDDGNTLVPLADEPYRQPPPPKTIGENPLAHLNLALPLPHFVAHLQNMRVYGDGGDVITADDVLLPDLSFRTPIRMWHEIGEHPLLEQTPLPAARHLEGTYALLSSRYAGENYFHWMFNVLPRLMFLERAGIERAQPDGYITNRLDLPAARETLTQLGIPADCIVELDRDKAFQCDSLWVTSSVFSTGHRLRSVHLWLREHFLTHSAVPRKRRLYLSRADARWRRMTNEDEVIEILKPLGFEKIVMGEHSVSEQARSFAQAEIVIAPHSAALANLVFCAPGTRVLDLIPENRLRAYYWELSACAGLDYYYVFSKPVTNPPPERADGQDTWMPLEPLRASLHQMGIE